MHYLGYCIKQLYINVGIKNISLILYSSYAIRRQIMNITFCVHPINKTHKINSLTSNRQYCRRDLCHVCGLPGGASGLLKKRPGHAGPATAMARCHRFDRHPSHTGLLMLHLPAMDKKYTTQYIDIWWTMTLGHRDYIHRYISI